MGSQSQSEKSRQRRGSPRATKSKPFRIKLQLIFSILLIVFGAGLIGFAVSRNFDLRIRNYEPKIAVGEQTPKPQFSKIESINIPKIKRNLAVSDGNFTDGRWEVSAEGVSFYTQSSLPDAGGNTVLYGHNKARILGRLVDVVVGDKIELRLENGALRVYEVVETRTIKPSEVDILNQTEESRLTIYTCSGFLDSARFVVVAHLRSS